jgi:hypothetical protein
MKPSRQGITRPRHVCEELIGKEIGMFVDRAALLWELDPGKMTPEQLDCIANHLIEKALAGRPQEMIAEAKRRIAAGEEVTVEQLEAGQKPAADPVTKNEPGEVNTSG